MREMDDETRIRTFLQVDYPTVVAGLDLASGSRAAAEDAVHEALARAWARMERGERIDSLKAWVTTVATNLVRSRFRRLRAERRARRRLGVEPVGTPGGGTEERLDLRRALEGLPERQREVVVVHYYLGFSVAETAEATGTSEGTVKKALHRARETLARALGEDYSTTRGER